MGPFVKKMVFVCEKPCVKYCVYTRRAKMGVTPKKIPFAFPTPLANRVPITTKGQPKLSLKE
jgi:hypothetical protein